MDLTPRILFLPGDNSLQIPILNHSVYFLKWIIPDNKRQSTNPFKSYNGGIQFYLIISIPPS